MPVCLPGSAGADGAAAMLGVMGGGQLARMFVHAAQAMGYRTAVLDLDPASPAGLVSHLHVRSAYDDPHKGNQKHFVFALTNSTPDAR